MNDLFNNLLMILFKYLDLDCLEVTYSPQYSLKKKKKTT